MHIAVIGAGPAGMTAAYELAKAGCSVELFEASREIGGMARSFDLWGQRVDLGPHRFFSNDGRVNRLWLEVVGRDYKIVNRLTRIYYRDRFFSYPLQPANALRNMGMLNAMLCVQSYLHQKLFARHDPNVPDSFESWTVQRFGRRLFDMFFRNYSEKLWGIPCSELDADFAAQRIKKFSLGEAIRNAMGLGRGKHKTLVDQFAYPLEGTGLVYERMADKVRALGGQVHLGTPVKRIVHDNRRVTGLEIDDGVHEFDHVVSTMPLTLMVRGLGDLPAPVSRALDRLRFRNTIVVYLHVDGTELFPDQWIYVQSPELLMGRVTNFRNWIPELYGSASTSILAIEYWAYDEDELWREDEAALVARASAEMQRTGLLQDARVLEGKVIRVPRCYPVYARGYKDLLQPIVDHLETFSGLSVIGRYGAFKYNNQDHSILMGILAADNIVKRENHNLWAINTDYESYQEKTAISETGLVEASA